LRIPFVFASVGKINGTKRKLSFRAKIGLSRGSYDAFLGWELFFAIVIKQNFGLDANRTGGK